MSAPAVTDPTLRSDEKPLAEYRSISKLALAAAFCGVASALVLVGPLLVPVALTAVVLAVVALRSIAASEGQLVGRLPAIVGLSLAVMFLGWGLSGYVSRQAQLETHARAFAESWLAIVAEGQYRQAHQLESPSAARIFSREALAAHYANDREAAERLEARISQPPMDAFVAEGSDVRYRYAGLAETLRHGRGDFVTLHYIIERPAERGGPRSMWIQVQRAVNPYTRQPDYMLMGVLPQAPGTSP